MSINSCLVLSWKKKIANLPSQCGCYLFTNQPGKIIYIGKAQNLKSRLSSYGQNSPKSGYFQQQIANFDIILTRNVKEALILEQNLIKKYQPRFNVLLKDSHYYPYLEITSAENPRYKLVRKVNPQKKGRYFGPFPDGSKAREILQLLERLFPLAKCRGNLGKPCFYYTIGQCSGHCWQKVMPSYYQQTITQIQQFFHGKTHLIKQKIKNSLSKNIKDLAFEIAQKEKKILDNLDFFTSKQNVEFKRAENYDFLGIYCPKLTTKNSVDYPINQSVSSENIIALFLLIYRYGKLSNTAEAIFPVWTEKAEVLQSWLFQFYQKNLPPQICYLPEPFAGQELLTEELGLRWEIPRRGRKKAILDLAHQNARQVWQKNYWNEFQQVNKELILTEIGKFLSISPPYFIECCDISNLYKQDIVAGFLVFLNGVKNLTRSKLYKLDNSELESDLARIKKACLIHYQKYLPADMPNLIIVDGGKEQVKAVQQALKELQLKTTVIGLAKNEKHQTAKIITHELRELNFGKEEKIRNFLTNCQAEVHRYAINFHRQLHRRSVLKNK